MMSMQRRGGEVLKFVTCLRILLFSYNTSIAHFCRWGGGGGVVDNCCMLCICTYTNFYCYMHGFGHVLYT